MLLIAGGAGAQAGLTPAVLDEVAAEPRSDAALPRGLRFSDENGQPRTLVDVRAGKPAILVFADYTCRTLCGPILTFVAAGLERSGLAAGADYGLVVIGLDPKDDSTSARAAKVARIGSGTPLAAATVMLTGEEAAITAATAALGYRYAYHAEHDQFAHPSAASDYANEVDGTFWVLVVISSLITLLVAALIAGFSLRYRRGSSARRGPLSERFGRDVEIGWTVATLFLFLFIFWWAASNQLSALDVPGRAMEIHVVAKQWMWRVQQPGGAREINEIHVPENVPIRLVMTSEDVIHDLFLPTMRLKQDVLPGRYTYLWFRPTKTGVFHLTCAEYCGTDHSVMAGRLVVMTAPDYAPWTTPQPEAA